ncbi:hypothetical protein FHR32_007761 [Streptosporangium album]|uniref:IstB-like ATP-binding domain-containing protein n=1 Tax=Streptosporangium album TaxID=47479 RepID=A0A7W7S5K6_9ACTN|nr:hypothetical protein [Streptosporangium album]
MIENLLRADLVVIDEVGFAPLDDTGAQLLFRFVAAAYERRALGIGSHWPFDQWGRFLSEHTTAVSLLDRLLHHSIVVATGRTVYAINPLSVARYRERHSVARAKSDHADAMTLASILRVDAACPCRPTPSWSIRYADQGAVAAVGRRLPGRRRSRRSHQRGLPPVSPNYLGFTAFPAGQSNMILSGTSGTLTGAEGMSHPRHAVPAARQAAAPKSRDETARVAHRRWRVAFSCARRVAWADAPLGDHLNDREDPTPTGMQA